MRSPINVPALASLAFGLLALSGSAHAQMPTDLEDLPAPRPARRYAYHQAGRPAPAYSQPTYYAPRYSDLRHGVLVILYGGVNFPVGSRSDGYSAGFNMGGIVGGHLNHDISLNGELSLSMLNYDHASSFQSEYLGAITFSPLFHLGQRNIEFAIGPKLGFFSYHFGYDDGYIWSSSSASGLAYGLNAVLLFQVAPTLSIGGLLSLTGHHATEACNVYPNGTEDCGNAANQPDMKLLTLNFAVRW
jgi:hypothetical protein